MTPDGTMKSHVIQLGDCNGGATYQTLMNYLFQPYLGVWMDVYLDDIIIYSDTAEDHVQHLKIVLDILIKEQFYLSKDKMQLFTTELKILGHIVDAQGIRMDPHKVNAVARWKTPTTADLLRNFLGAVGFLAPNVPQIRIPMGHLNKLIEKNAPYNWTATMDRAFEKVKELVQVFRDCHRIPIDYSPGAEAINLVTDACLTGIGGLVSQGNNWQTANVVAFYPAKLSATQQNYPVHDKEFLAGLETMLRHRDILQGAHFRWFTDHKVLEYFLTQDKLSPRQSRWLEKIADITTIIYSFSSPFLT